MTPAYYQTRFDNPEIWDASAWQGHKGDLERAQLAAAWMPDDVRSILDVGCGNGIFTNLADSERLKIGLDLSRVALMQVRAPRVQGQAAWLPFPDHSFDATVSMEMLEHLPLPLYPKVLMELTRITRKYVLISVPVNEVLEYSHVVCPACQCKFHIYHHVRTYNPVALKGLFAPRFRLIRLEGVAHSKEKVFPALWNLIRIYLHRGGRHFPSHVVCPQCGYSSSTSGSYRKSTTSHSVNRSPGRLWPKRSTYIWWMALYQEVA